MGSSPRSWHCVSIPTLKLRLPRSRGGGLGTNRLYNSSTTPVRWGHNLLSIITGKFYLSPTLIVQWNSCLNPFNYLYFTDEETEELGNFPKKCN